MSNPFSMMVTATAGDIDELGHVSNLVYLRWVLDVALAHSQAVGWDHAAYRAFGAVWVVKRHEIDYVASVYEGQTIIAETWVDDWRGVSCIRKTQLTHEGRVVAKAATMWALIAFATGKPTRIPDEMRARFQ